jgi:biopolymer transport protein ExbB/TolQ
VIVLVSAAPLMGLLGTVLGMLTTFEGIAAGGGRMVDGIARGISEALITTEMGLLIALPGLVLSYWVRRKRNDYVAFLARLESLTLQHHRRRFEGEDAPPAYRIQNTTPQRHRGGESELPSNLSPANA